MDKKNIINANNNFKAMGIVDSNSPFYKKDYINYYHEFNLLDGDRFVIDHAQLERAWTTIKQSFPHLKNEKQNKWFYYWIKIVNYFVGEFKETTNNSTFKKISINFFYELFANNQVAITYQNNQFWIVYINNKTPIEANNPFNTDYVYNCRIVNDSGQEFEVVLGEKEIAYASWGFKNSLNNFILWKDVLDTVVKLEDVFVLNSLMSIKKFMRYTNSTDLNVLQEEENEILNTNSPFITIKGSLVRPSGEMESDFEELKIQSDYSTQSFDNLTKFVNFHFNMLGYATTQEMKKERTTMSEGATSIHNTTNLQSIVLQNLELFSDKVQENWDIVLKFDVNHDLTSTYAEVEDLEHFSKKDQEDKKGTTDHHERN